MTGSSLRGRYLWYDLMTSDVEAAKAFYRDVAGWGVETWDGGGKPYDMWTAGGQPIGGVMDLPPEAVEAGAPPHWLAYIGVPDVDVAAARAVESGGTQLHEPMDIPTVGRFAVFCDPDGAVFALFRPEGDMEGRCDPPAVGRISWNELLAGDYEKAFEFYRELFGWTVVEDMDMGEYGIYRIYASEGPPLGGIMSKPPGMATGAWLFYIRTDALDAALDRVRAAGGVVLNGPMDVPGGDRVAQCRDPQGASFALHEVAPGA